MGLIIAMYFIDTALLCSLHRRIDEMCHELHEFFIKVNYNWFESILKKRNKGEVAEK